VEALLPRLNPDDFFRVNRQLIVSFQAIHAMHTWFKRRIKLELDPSFDKEVIVAAERVKEFKDWLNR